MNKMFAWRFPGYLLIDYCTSLCHSLPDTVGIFQIARISYIY